MEVKLGTRAYLRLLLIAANNFSVFSENHKNKKKLNYVRTNICIAHVRAYRVISALLVARAIRVVFILHWSFTLESGNKKKALQSFVVLLESAWKKNEIGYMHKL